jgi:hypothetical protein
MRRNPPPADRSVRKMYRYGSGKGVSLSATGISFPVLRGVREPNLLETLADTPSRKGPKLEINADSTPVNRCRQSVFFRVIR